MDAGKRLERIKNLVQDIMVFMNMHAEKDFIVFAEAIGLINKANEKEIGKLIQKLKEEI